MLVLLPVFRLPDPVPLLELDDPDWLLAALPELSGWLLMEPWEVLLVSLPVP